MYKCNQSFTSENGRFYNYGEKISGSHYAMLSYSEQNNFTYIGVDDDIVSDVVDTAIAIGSIVSSFSGDDGGDSGGAGASGDW